MITPEQSAYLSDMHGRGGWRRLLFVFGAVFLVGCGTEEASGPWTLPDEGAVSGEEGGSIALDEPTETTQPLWWFNNDDDDDSGSNDDDDESGNMYDDDDDSGNNHDDDDDSGNMYDDDDDSGNMYDDDDDSGNMYDDDDDSGNMYDDDDDSGNNNDDDDDSGNMYDDDDDSGNHQDDDDDASGGGGGLGDGSNADWGEFGDYQGCGAVVLLTQPVESKHPYSNYSQEQKWVYAPSYAHKMRVFFSRISLRHNDRILIKDRWGDTVQTIKGPVEHTDFWTKIVDGNRIQIVLRPDGNHTDWGFRITAQRHVWEGYQCNAH